MIAGLLNSSCHRSDEIKDGRIVEGFTMILSLFRSVAAVFDPER